MQYFNKHSCKKCNDIVAILETVLCSHLNKLSLIDLFKYVLKICYELLRLGIEKATSRVGNMVCRYCNDQKILMTIFIILAFIVLYLLQ